MTIFNTNYELLKQQQMITTLAFETSGAMTRETHSFVQRIARNSCARFTGRGRFDYSQRVNYMATFA